MLSIQRRTFLFVLLLGMVISYLIITHFYERKQYQLELQVASFSLKYASGELKALGPLEVRNEIMYLGNDPINGKTALSDSITANTGFGCSIFLKEVCIATNSGGTDYLAHNISYDPDPETVQKLLDPQVPYVGTMCFDNTNWVVSSKPLIDLSGNAVGTLAVFKKESAFYKQLTAFKLMIASVFVALFVLIVYLFSRLNRKRTILEEKNSRMEKMSEALKWAIKESEKSRTKYKSLFDNTFDLIQEVSMEGKFLYVNNAWKQTLGYTQEEISELTMWQIVHPDYHHHCSRVLLEVHEQEKVSNVDVAFVDKHGDAILLNGNIHREADAEGNITTRGIFRNDTKRKMMHARLKESERQYRLLVESVDDVIFRTDLHGNFIYINEKAVEVTQFSFKQLLRMSYEDLLPEEDREKIMSYFQAHFKTRARNNYFEFRIKTRDGQLKWIGQNLTTIFANGTDTIILGYMAVARDITQLKEQQEQLRIAHDALNLKNKEITSSISYAKMIQHSHLPKLDILKGYFPDSFLIYEPKDIVSGDFYWFGETKDHLIIAVGDCTGHGVPGAFMTMIGLNQLTNIIYDKKVYDPASILEQLDDDICNGVKTGNGESDILDGMDIAICTYHKKTKVLEFSGARRPLFMVSSKTLYRFSPSKRSIGERLLNYDVSFQTQVIDYKKGDMIYLFSDGLKDQFGGVLSKKFSLKKLRELFIENAKLSAAKQHELMRNVFFDWKKDHEQTDDVLLIGFKM